MTHVSDAMTKSLTTQAPEPVNMGLAFDDSTHGVRCLWVIIIPGATNYFFNVFNNMFYNFNLFSSAVNHSVLLFIFHTFKIVFFKYYTNWNLS